MNSLHISRYFYPCITLALFGLLVFFQMYKAFHTPLYFDDAYFANMAKSLAMGRGYSAVYFTQLIPFHWNASSGPVVILPAALMIYLFGNSYWAPSLACILLIVLLLCISFYYVRQISAEKKWQCAAFFLFSAMLLSNHEIGPPAPMLIWHGLLGEIPSALFVIISIVMLAARAQDPKRWLVAGVIAGLAVLCKLLSLVGLGTAMLALAFACYRETEMNQRFTYTVKNIGHYGLGILVPNAIYETVKYCLLGGEVYLQRQKALLAWVHDYNRPSEGLAWIFGKLTIVGQYFGVFPQQVTPPTFMQLFFMAVVLLGTAFSAFYCLQRIWKKQASPLLLAGGALLCAANAHIWWYLVFSAATMPRYLSQGIIYFCAGIALLLSEISLIPSLNAAKKAMIYIGLAVLLLYARQDAAVYYFEHLMTGNDALAEQQDVLKFLRDMLTKAPDTVIFSCGNTMEMEYLLPGSGNFIPCETLSKPEYAVHPKVLLSYYESDSLDQLYLTPDTSRVKSVRNPEKVSSHCLKDDLYSGTYYTIASCVSR